MLHNLEPIEKQFKRLAEQRSAFWVIKDTKNRKSGNIAANHDEQDIDKAWELLESAMEDAVGAGFEKLTIFVKKSEFDGKAVEIKYDASQPIGSPTIMPNDKNFGLVGMLMQQMQQNTDAKIAAIKMENRLKKEIEESRNYQAPTIAQQVREIFSIIESSEVGKMAISNLSHIGAMLLSSNKGKMTIGTLENNYQNQNQNNMSRKEKLSNAIDILENYTTDPEGLILKLAEFVQKDPTKANSVISFIGLTLDKLKNE